MAAVQIEQIKAVCMNGDGDKNIVFNNNNYFNLLLINILINHLNTFVINSFHEKKQLFPIEMFQLIQFQIKHAV